MLGLLNRASHSEIWIWEAVLAAEDSPGVQLALVWFVPAGWLEWATEELSICWPKTADRFSLVAGLARALGGQETLEEVESARLYVAPKKGQRSAPKWPFKAF